MSAKPRYLVGIDEVGRGPMAGPVTIGVFAIDRKHLKKIDFANDSKQLSETKRDEIYTQLTQLKKEGVCNFITVSKSAQMINRHGISKCIQDAISQGLQKLCQNPKDFDIKLDGLLYAPSEFIHQETIIKGDSKEKVIGAASIIAKVTRDKFMIRQAKKNPEYGFEQHKGYGTKQHREAIQQSGTCPLHRDLWVRNIV